MSLKRSFNRIEELKNPEGLSLVPRNHEIDFSSGWLERAIDNGDIPPEYAEPTHTAELDVREISQTTIEAQQLALDSINRRKKSQES